MPPNKRSHGTFLVATWVCRRYPNLDVSFMIKNPTKYHRPSSIRENHPPTNVQWIFLVLTWLTRFLDYEKLGFQTENPNQNITQKHKSYQNSDINLIVFTMKNVKTEKS